MAKDLQPDDKPQGAGAVVTATVFVNQQGMQIKRIPDDILQSVDGKLLTKSTASKPIFIEIGRRTYKITDIIDRSEGYRLTREIVLAEPRPDELDDLKPEVTIH